MPPNPMVQQLQQVQQQLQAPQWSDILALLKNDLQRAYRVDIETNSTVEPEAAEDKENIVDLLTVLGQYLQGVTPLIVSQALPFEAAQSMMLAIARRFRFGTEIEDSLKAMKQPPPPPSDNAGQAEQMQMQQEAAMKDVQHAQEKGQVELQVKNLQADQQHAQRKTDQDVRELKIQHAAEMLSKDQQMAQEKLGLRDQVSQHKLKSDQKVASLENSKFKTENVVNQKADQTLGKGIQAMQAMVETLVQTVATQAKHQEQMLTALTQAITAPRTKKAIRGTDGKIEAVEDRVA